MPPGRKPGGGSKLRRGPHLRNAALRMPILWPASTNWECAICRWPSHRVTPQRPRPRRRTADLTSPAAKTNSHLRTVHPEAAPARCARMPEVLGAAARSGGSCFQAPKRRFCIGRGRKSAGPTLPRAHPPSFRVICPQATVGPGALVPRLRDCRGRPPLPLPPLPANSPEARCELCGPLRLPLAAAIMPPRIPNRPVDPPPRIPHPHYFHPRFYDTRQPNDFAHGSDACRRDGAVRRRGCLYGHRARRRPSHERPPTAYLYPLTSPRPSPSTTVHDPRARSCPTCIPACASLNHDAPLALLRPRRPPSARPRTQPPSPALCLRAWMSARTHGIRSASTYTTLAYDACCCPPPPTSSPVYISFNARSLQRGGKRSPLPVCSVNHGVLGRSWGKGCAAYRSSLTTPIPYPV